MNQYNANQEILNYGDEMIYETSYLIHYNHNHDKLGRFAKSSTSVLTKTKDIKKTIKPVNDYINRMDKESYDNLMLGEDGDYMSMENVAAITARAIKKIGDVPISTFDMFNDKYETNVAVSTDPKYKGKGHASEVVKLGMQYMETHQEQFKNTVIWGVATRNKASIRLAEKNGFVKIPKSEYNVNGIDTVLYKRVLDKKKEFDNEMQWVDKKKSNVAKAYNKQPLNIQEIKERAGLNDAEANTCGKIANKIFDKASKYEPKITKDLQSSVNKRGSLYGLDYRLKQPNSIAAKIGADSKENKVDFNTAANDIKDSIRYTVINQNDNFVKNYNTIKNDLLNKGYNETKCKNYFDRFDKGTAKHKSVQSVFVNNDGISFEIQFQTPESQAAKNLKVPIYEERRKLTNTKERNLQLEKQMEDLANMVPNPKRIYSIKEH